MNIAMIIDSDDLRYNANGFWDTAGSTTGMDVPARMIWAAVDRSQI
jgi:hypothetical protein